jgi:tight adherence protein B
VNEHIDQIAGLLGGLSVLLALAGYALHGQQQQLGARLRVFVGGGSLDRGAPDGAGTLRFLRQWGVWRRVRLGAQPIQLVQAGVSLTPRRFLFLQLTAGVVGLGLTRLVTAPMGLEGPTSVLVLAGGSGVGLAVPRIVLRVKRSRRLTRFEGQFASALDALANGIEVGLSLSQALEMVSRDMPQPLGPEFGQVVRGLGMGLPLGEALDRLAERVPLRDVEIFVTAVHIQYRTGGGLSQVLRSIAATVRQRVNLRGEVRAMTAQQRYSAYLVSLLPVGIAIIIRIVNPAYFDKLLQPGTMRLLLLGAGAGVVIGFYLMMRIADIEA